MHIIFDETNFMTSEQETGDFKIGLANLEDDESIHIEKDQEVNEELQVQIENVEPNQEQEQQGNQDQQGVPDPAAPRVEQNEQSEAE
jgi:phage FluMu gp28-like protein